MHTEHGFERIGSYARACHGVVRLDDLEQRLPGHDHFHLGKEDFPASLFLLPASSASEKLIGSSLALLSMLINVQSGHPWT